MYNPTLKMEKGEKLMSNIDKKINETITKVTSQIKSIGIDFTELSSSISNLKINKKLKKEVPSLNFRDLKNEESPRLQKNLFVEDP